MFDFLAVVGLLAQKGHCGTALPSISSKCFPGSMMGTTARTELAVEGHQATDNAIKLAKTSL